MPDAEKSIRNIRIIWVAEIRMVKNGPGMIFEELMTENFPQLLKEIKLYIPEALQTQSKINTTPPFPNTS